MKTKKAPWDYDRYQPRLPIHDIQLETIMLINELERDYGINHVAGIIKAWGKIEWPDKLERVKELKIELDTQADRKSWVNDPKHYKTRGSDG